MYKINEEGEAVANPEKPKEDKKDDKRVSKNSIWYLVQLFGVVLESLWLIYIEISYGHTPYFDCKEKSP
ncbi:hypothetical protein HV819_11060 [Anaerococcus sp. AGMB00486]|uniref:Uncharacterized protein n=1 Tax=Anaerococcus faecalis TaxID=2742993 RepID=A0ABX2ND86_9FIRM|nr:hypothetical protein [Anaerococcus faecalis]NVF12494.1 hypothetical protein [Anaerococcus faecalis]